MRGDNKDSSPDSVTGSGSQDGRGSGPRPSALAYLRGELAALEAADLLRRRPAPFRADVTSFADNDYLGLAQGPAGEAPFGAGASRLVAGEHSEHAALERALSGWLRTEAALLFASGYAANLGTIAALADSPDDLIVSDALNHASIVDGCRLARARAAIYPHLDIEEARRALRTPVTGRKWLVTESYFSMDADSPDLAAMRAAADECGAALIVDEAHAVGLLGPEGRGVAAEVGVVADVTVGTLGKALGGSGAFVAGGRDLTDWLWNRARPFVFSTGLSPLVASHVLNALGRAEADEGLRSLVAARAAQLRTGLEHLGLRPLGYGHIVPVVIGEAREAVAIAERLKGEGFVVQAIRPPSVPRGGSRIRLTATAKQSASDVERLLGALARCFT